MRKFLIITLVLVAVLAMATAASASVRDGVASLVGARDGAAADSGDGGTYTVKALKSGDPEPSEDAWAVRTTAETTNAGEVKAISYGPVVEPSGDGDCDADRTGDEIAPVGPEAEVQPEEPVAAETATKKEKKGQQEDSTVE